MDIAQLAIRDFVILFYWSPTVRYHYRNWKFYYQLQDTTYHKIVLVFYTSQSAKQAPFLQTFLLLLDELFIVSYHSLLTLLFCTRLRHTFWPAFECMRLHHLSLCNGSLRNVQPIIRISHCRLCGWHRMLLEDFTPLYSPPISGRIIMCRIGQKVSTPI